MKYTTTVSVYHRARGRSLVLGVDPSGETSGQPPARLGADPLPLYRRAPLHLSRFSL
jgi:hypothetical protein